MSGGIEAAAQREREQHWSGTGKLIKQVVDQFSDQDLGYWYEEIRLAREGIVKDGKFSKDGILWLDRLHSLERMLISEYNPDAIPNLFRR